MRFSFHRIFLSALSLCLLFLFSGCTCCVYYNHMFNGERAYDEGVAMSKARVDSVATDTTLSPGERQKFDRAIEKGSRVLERFPEDMEYKPRALFMIAESFRRKSEYPKAVLKYDELERYFPEDDSIPAAEFWRAWCLYRNRDFSLSRFALDRVLDKGEKHPYYNEALGLLSLLEEQADQPESAIAALEKALSKAGGSPFTRGQARLRLAELYFRLENWEKAFANYVSIDILALADAERVRAGLQAAECLVNLKRFPEAIAQFRKTSKEPMVGIRIKELQVRIGEVLLLADSTEAGLELLTSEARAGGNSEPSSRAWFDVGDHYQFRRQDYPTSILYYDSSFSAMPSCTWAQKSRERKESIQKILASREKRTGTTASGPSPREEFQIAELFLFKLDEVDSALKTLDRIVDTLKTDTVLAAKAAYARAFINAEYKKDSLKADTLYRFVIARYPNSSFAQRAQMNLGMSVSVRTKEDLAHDAFLLAEATYDSLHAVPSDSVAQVDTLFAHTISRYDTVAIAYAGTTWAPKALFAKGYILETEAQDVAAAKLAYEALAKQYPASEQAAIAKEKLSPHFKVTDAELDRLRKRVQENQKSADDSRKKYEEQMKKEREERAKRKSDDEVLDDDYNNMYDFQ